MITVKKMIRKEQGLCLIVTELDAEAAGINTECKRDCVDAKLVDLLINLGEKVTSDTRAKHLKDYLVEVVFSHYVDMVAILDYVYNIRKVMSSVVDNPSHSKFLFVTEFVNFDDIGDLEEGCEGGCENDDDGGCGKDK